MWVAGPSPASAFPLFNRDVSKAKKFIKAGMYPQAIAVPEKRINDEPDDAEAHFLLGRCYIHTGNLRGADTRFESADIENALSFARFPACSSGILPVFRPLFDDNVARGQTERLAEAFSGGLDRLLEFLCRVQCLQEFIDGNTQDIPDSQSILSPVTQETPGFRVILFELHQAPQHL